MFIGHRDDDAGTVAPLSSMLGLRERPLGACPVNRFTVRIVLRWSMHSSDGSSAKALNRLTYWKPLQNLWAVVSAPYRA